MCHPVKAPIRQLFPASLPRKRPNPDEMTWNKLWEGSQKQVSFIYSMCLCSASFLSAVACEHIFNVFLQTLCGPTCGKHSGPSVL